MGAPKASARPMLDLLPSTAPADLPSLLASLSAVAPLLDAMPGVVLFVNDAQARYVLVNQTLATRCGYRDYAVVTEMFEALRPPDGGAYQPGQPDR